MAKYRVRVNPLFKGELTLPTINYPVKGGTLLILDEEQYSGSDIQVALKKKYLLEEVEESKAKSKTKKPQALTPIIVEKGEVPKKPKLSAILKQLESSNVMDGTENPNESIDPTKGDTKTTPTVWDAYEKKGIDAKEGVKKAMQQLNSVKMEIQQGEVDFDDEQKNKKETAKKPKKVSAKKTEPEQGKKLPIPNLDLGDDDQLFVETKPIDTKKKAIKRIPENNAEVE